MKDNYCRICGSSRLIKTKYPNLKFNNKVFEYLECSNCSSYNIFPSPDESDFKLMYGENDHTYLKGVVDKLEYNYNYPFAHHQGYQIKFLNEIKSQLKGKTLLDYACGSGFYMNYAEELGAKTIGIEFDEDFVSVLKKKTDLEIYTQSQFENNFEGKTFDFIHLGHVLEHLPDPKDLFLTLQKYAHEDTVFIIDGPLERNKCLHRFYIDFGSRIKGKKQRDGIPQHLSLTSASSQLLFFTRANLEKENYIVTEQYFPLPNTLGKSIGGIFSYLIASISIFISSIVPNYGNIFHFRGKMKKL